MESSAASSATSPASTPITASTSGGSVTGAQASSTAAYTPVEVNVRTLLEAGAHFGHQAERWNPKMLPYIYCERNGIHVINLDSTISAWQTARRFIVDTLARGGHIMFVGTKQQARDLVTSEAQRCGAYYMTSRWLGGCLSNFKTIKNSIDRMRKLEEFLVKADAGGTDIKISKKEKLSVTRALGKLSINLSGIRHMRKAPDVIFVTDIRRESIAVAEARSLRIPVVALVDTNCDPELVAHAIPCNDDASRTLSLFTAAVADAVIEGTRLFNSRQSGGAHAVGSGQPSAKDGQDREGAKHPASQQSAQV
jgi:small subunit ribosomal protein S2